MLSIGVHVELVIVFSYAFEIVKPFIMMIV